MYVFISTLNLLIELQPILNFVLDILVCCCRYVKKDLKVKISDQMINDGEELILVQKSHEISHSNFCVHSKITKIQFLFIYARIYGIRHI